MDANAFFSAYTQQPPPPPSTNPKPAGEGTPLRRSVGSSSKNINARDLFGSPGVIHSWTPDRRAAVTGTVTGTTAVTSTNDAVINTTNESSNSSSNSSNSEQVDVLEEEEESTPFAQQILVRRSSLRHNSINSNSNASPVAPSDHDTCNVNYNDIIQLNETECISNEQQQQEQQQHEYVGMAVERNHEEQPQHAREEKFEEVKQHSTSMVPLQLPPPKLPIPSNEHDVKVYDNSCGSDSGGITTRHTPRRILNLPTPPRRTYTHTPTIAFTSTSAKHHKNDANVSSVHTPRSSSRFKLPPALVLPPKRTVTPLRRRQVLLPTPVKDIVLQNEKQEDGNGE